MYATTRPDERVAAAMGALPSAPIQFETASDVPKGGVPLALPALPATGLLRHTEAFYALPNGFYGIASIFPLLALMALARIKSLEQLRYVAPGEWGKLLELDRIPEVRTLRQKHCPQTRQLCPAEPDQESPVGAGQYLPHVVHPRIHRRR